MLRNFFFIILLLIGFSARAENFNYADFSRIPIQHEGRIKPMDTFALVYLEKFYGKSRINGMEAPQWLAKVMFEPAVAMDMPVFRVKDVDVQAMLKLSVKPDNLYSFMELVRAIGDNRELIKKLALIPTKDLSAAQRSVLELYEGTDLFTQLMLSSSLYLKIDINLSQELLDKIGFSSGVAKPVAFIDYFPYLRKMEDVLREVIYRKGDRVERYTEDEARLAMGAQRLVMTSESGLENKLLRIVPPGWSGSEEWLSPWAVFHSGKGSPKSAEIMSLWRELSSSYQEQDASRWNKASFELRDKLLAAPGVRPQAISLEVLYYKWWPLGNSMLLYIVGFVMALFCLTGVQNIYKPARISSIALVSAGAVLHFVGIAARIYILDRPPVGTLYESIIFVSLVVVLFGLYLEWRQRNNLGILVATIVGGALLFLSQGFRGEDSMGMLIAVLNTNFWLSTHVICISIGYSFGMVAGSIAHVYLIQRIWGSEPKKAKQILQGAYGTALIALLFTTVGTILGGVWADQSWGRFWGWDPKENGALLICLWLIWLLHSKITGQMAERGFAALLAALNVVIAFSWLGVNLLSTGLHSYGFTDNAAFGFAAFCVLELLFVLVAYIIIWRRDYAAK
jgi:ABC-type transport system involved in cytochrome c biogenesis permease subunit